eukprot:snap_masked-scaffold_27-processed-gene-4.24-mRNA-1 protein AED:1.00 eAED:1.00 QI:0/0/0/0/1/1/6/0/791
MSKSLISDGIINILFYLRKYNTEGKVIDPSNFREEIVEFIKEFQPDQQVTYLKFYNCPFFALNSQFYKFLLLFPAVKTVRFESCSFSDGNFKAIKDLTKWKLNYLKLESCYIPDIYSFCKFLKSTGVKELRLLKNIFCSKSSSTILKSLFLNKILLKIEIHDKKDETLLDIATVSNFLKTNSTIKILIYSSEYTQKRLSETDIVDLQHVVDSHRSIIGLKVNEIFIEPKGRSEALRKIVHSALQRQYEEISWLSEVPVILMGDGRTGKTSLLRNLSGKSFQKETQSTLVLEDYQIFQVDRNKFKPLTKYDLSVQRVKNIFDFTYLIQDQVQNKPKYNLDFEDELITRIIGEKSFVQQYTTRYDSDFITAGTFLRVYDFGGQQVFSSVHHIFMKEKAIYLVVFNMTKLKEKDLFRLKFWCESILRNASRAPVILVGTFLSTFLKKNKKEELHEVNEIIKLFLKKQSNVLNVLQDETTIFFATENAVDFVKSRECAIKQKLWEINLTGWRLDQLFDLDISIKSVYVLFLDNCREESNYMTVQNFRKKAKKSNFCEEEIEEMLQIYSQEGIICYFKNINLSESENLIFFAPSFLAQALGSFIRDESFHQLAFRTNKNAFSNYRKYIDTGIIRKDLFEVLLKQYTKKEREYVLSLALHSLILFVDPREKNSFIVPELLPEVKDSQLKISLTPDFVLKTGNSITKEKFLQMVFIFLKHKRLEDSFLFKFFSRIIFGPNEILDIFLIQEKELGFRIIGRRRNYLLETLVQQFIEERSVCEHEAREVFYHRDRSWYDM